MSKYIPHASVTREFYQQIKRKLHGLKTGEYVKYPDAEKGPFVLRADKALELQAQQASETKDAPSSNT